MADSIVTFFDQYPEYSERKIEDLSYHEQKDIVLKMFSFAISQAHQGNPRWDLICEAASRTKRFTKTDRDTFRWIGVSALNSVNSAIHRMVYVDTKNADAKKDRLVYFVRSGNRVKIGTTKNLQSRIQSLRVASPGTLEILATVVGGRELEIELHERFNSSRIVGEWFTLSPEILDYIKPHQH